MDKDYLPDSLDVAAFARDSGRLEACDELARYRRVVADITDTADGRRVDWRADGQWRTVTGGAGQPWLHLQGSTLLPMTCQRCLLAVDVPVAFETDFRFVADESTAEAEDDESEEDVLALRRDFPLRELVEDELLLALPAVPMHEVCPVALPTEVEDPDFAAAGGEKANPFAVLAGLHKGKLG